MMAWFFANLGWASVIMLLVLAVRRPFAALFGAGAAYALWLLPALRLVMPPLPSFAPDLPALAPPETLVVWVEDAAVPLPAASGWEAWLPVLLACWALGAAGLLAWQFLSYRRFLTELSLSSRSIGAHRGLPLIESAAVQGPVALGLLDRRIIVPADFRVRYTAEEQRLALDHEAIHHRRGDLWCNHLGLVILALNWFNPVAWIAFRAYRADQELACDSAVAAAASSQARHDYARALIKSASRPGLIAACPLNHADQLKRRLRMMKEHKVSRLRLLGGAAAVTLLAGAGLALGSPSFAAQEGAPAPEAKQERSETRDERRDERVIIHTHRVGESAHRDRARNREHSAHRDGNRHVFVLRRGGEGEREGHAAGEHRGEVHSFVLERRGRESGEGHQAHGGMAGHHVAIAGCGDGNRRIVDESDGDDDRRTRFILCGPNEMDPARRIAALQRAREHLADEGDFSGEQRARIIESLDREIARLRAQ